VKPVLGKRMCRILEGHDWVCVRIKSAHHTFQRPGNANTVIVPVHGNEDLKPGAQRGIMRDAGKRRPDVMQASGALLALGDLQDGSLPRSVSRPFAPRSHSKRAGLPKWYP